MIFHNAVLVHKNVLGRISLRDIWPGVAQLPCRGLIGVQTTRLLDVTLSN